MQVSEVQDKVDTLNEEFTRLSRQSLEADSSIRELEQELMAQMDLLKDSTDHAQNKQLIRETASKLTAAKSNRDSLALQRSNCLQRFQMFKKQLEEKTSQLNLHKTKPENERQKQTEKKLQSLTKGQKKRGNK